MTLRTKVIMVLLGSMLFFAHSAHAQVDENTLSCNVPNCLVYTSGTSWTLAIDVTAMGDYEFIDVSLEAYADVSANGCNDNVIGQVDGGVYNGPLTNGIGIIAQSIGADTVTGLNAEYSEVNYLDGTLSETGGGTFPC